MNCNPTNLPRQPLPFIGRKREIKKIIGTLKSPDCRLFTLVGPGGIGKTRLAIKIGEELLGEYKDGVYFVPLAHIELVTPQSLVFQIADSINFKFYGGQPPEAQLIKFLDKKTLILIIDNFEHGLDSVTSHFSRREIETFPDVIEVSGRPSNTPGNSSMKPRRKPLLDSLSLKADLPWRRQER